MYGSLQFDVLVAGWVVVRPTEVQLLEHQLEHNERRCYNFRHNVSAVNNITVVLR